MTISTTPTTVRTQRDLHDGWTLRAVGGPVAADVAGRTVPATVPGSVHTDLLAAGLIVDPYLDDHEHLLAWIGRCDWEYRTTFPWTPGGQDRHELVFEGLDTVATVTLNGREVARTANMHRTYRVDVGPLLREGDNELAVVFASPVRHADRQSLALGYRPQVNKHPFNAIRKMACSFGWDWGLDTATSGIWRPVRLESWSTARLAAVRPVVSVVDAGGHGDVAPGQRTSAATGVVDVHVDVARAGAHTAGQPLLVTARVGGHASTAEVEADGTDVVVRVEVPDAALWWPRGYGEQPLYDVEVELRPAAAGADVVDTWRGRIGFRTVALELEPDDEGTSFRFVVNGQPVFIHGANWIPDDAFPHRVTRDRYAARIAQAEYANLNLLRVWGGGIYESDDFYDLCDERGMLTWQDFLFACAAYSEDDPLRAEVEAEARDNVTRLMPHASLVLWNGSNENIWGFQEWGWEGRLQGRTWGLGYYTDLLPRVVRDLDPGRPYTPSSPWSGSLDVHPNSPDHGSMHSWELWNRQDYPHYRDTVPRFMAEFGWQGPPTWSTLTRAISDDPLTPESPGMQVHQKAMSGNDKLTDGLVPHLPMPDTMEDWHWAMSLNQANAVQVAVEHLRSWSPRCMGSVVWQLNDCWPVTSWAAVDGDGHAKPLLHALKHAHAPRLLTVQPRPSGNETDAGTPPLAVAVVNDTPEPWSGDLVLRRLDFTGVELDATKMAVSVAARDTAVVLVPDAVSAAGDAGTEVLVATLGDERALWFYAEARDSALEAAPLATDVQRTASGARVRVTAEKLARDVSLLVDKVHPDATVDDMLVTLLPGESVTFTVDCPPDADIAELTSRRVLRTTNELLYRSFA
ncbi:glycoside hydrolase family 2 protein [Cellulomonas sp. NPDC057328]|uniref:glycoside hydrolase family 2 protein n=1 Tax=Cellulomonas sp. NPDC057328 TaxID=3346101 RepID=UPI00363ADE50